jgi:NADH-quinone oxidoreductase subunit N
VDVANFVGLLPLMVIAATAVAVLLLVAVRRHHLAAAIMTVIGLGGAVMTIPLAARVVPRRITSLLIVDSYGLFFYMALLTAASMIVVILTYGYLQGREGNLEEFYVLLLLATLGAVALALSNHFASLFLGLELLSVGLYTLIAYLRTSARPLEAAVKYLILAAASAAFLLFGLALIYAELGTMEFERVAMLLATADKTRSVFVLTGLAMTVTGIGFKLAVVPFHMWTPDLYEGAPAPVAAFVATVSKGAVVALLLRYVMQTGAYPYGSLMLAFSVMAAASMVVGNLLALLQENVKRILAYSSIAHLGYLLVALVAGGSRGVEAATYYLVAYMLTTLSAFGSVIVLSDTDRDAETMAAYCGLFWRRPWLAVVFTAAILSLAGIPLTAGFVGKFYVLVAGVESTLWPLILLLVFGSAVGLFYYLRIVVAVYGALPEGADVPATTPAPSRTFVTSLVLTVLTLGVVWLGLYPAPLIHTIRLTVASLL